MFEHNLKNYLRTGRLLLYCQALLRVDVFNFAAEWCLAGQEEWFNRQSCLFSLVLVEGWVLDSKPCRGSMWRTLLNSQCTAWNRQIALEFTMLWPPTLSPTASLSKPLQEPWSEYLDTYHCLILFCKSVSNSIFSKLDNLIHPGWSKQMWRSEQKSRLNRIQTSLALYTWRHFSLHHPDS